jgi:hypothetical protein
MTRATNADLPAPFFDLAMAVVFVFMALFLISSLDTPKPASGAVTPKAEFLITLDWNDGSMDDVDLWVRGPDKEVVFFGKKRTPLMFLDNDNMGRNNGVRLPNGERATVPGRREVVTIRSTQAGEYCVNAHLYRRIDTTPTALRLSVVKINPYRVVTEASAVFDKQGQEQTLACFTLDAHGDVSAVYVVPVKMVGRG